MLGHRCPDAGHTRLAQIPPLFLFLIAGGASLLRAFGIPEIANAVAFPFNLAAILLSLREIRAQRARSLVSLPAG